jgi:phenylacetate-CoA ligase
MTIWWKIINPATGEPVAEGQEGEMVLTTLNREGLPLIRYRTRDITSVLTTEKCACGRTALRDKLDFLPGGTIPRTPGKAVRVVDKRG